MTTLKQIRDNMTDDKKLLLDLSLSVIKKIYGDNITEREITKLSKEIIADMTDVSFDNLFRCMYEGKRYNVNFEVIVHMIIQINLALKLLKMYFIMKQKKQKVILFALEVLKVLLICY